jgi:hypothetical protein
MMPAPRITTWEESDMDAEDGEDPATKEAEDLMRALESTSTALASSH